MKHDPIEQVRPGLLFRAARSGRRTTASAQQPGITDTEIKFGNIMPYSGPASALSVTGKVFAAYFDMINEKGGVNGRKLNMISLDDGFSPPKTVEATRRLVENDNVAFMFGTMGTAPSSATAKYLNGAKVPHLFLISSASKWNEPATQPWLMALPWAPNYVEEAGIEVRYARAKNPNARFAILYQNDDAGKDYLRGVKEALGADADKAIAMASSFEVADPTVDSQILTLANTKADVFLIYSVTPRACAQAIRKAHETGWRPMRFISSGCANKDTVMVPAGARGVDRHHVGRGAEALQPDSKDAGLLAYADFMKARLPNVDPATSPPAMATWSRRRWSWCWSSARTISAAPTSWRRPPTSRASRSRCCCPASRSTPRRPTTARSRTAIWSNFATTS